MSQEYQSLQITSQLPDWLAGEEALSQFWLLEMAGTHGDEQDQIEYLRARMGQGQRPPGVLPIIAHRAAADSGQRFISSAKQLMAYYPGNFNSKVLDSRVAAGITWLTKQLCPQHLVIDRHDNTAGNKYACFGLTTTPAAIAAAYLLGHTTAQIARWSTFRNAVPRSVLVEEIVNEKQAYHRRADQRIEKISALGNDGLTALFYQERLWQKFTFYESVAEVCLVDLATGKPNASVLSILPELEAAGRTGRMGSELRLSNKARDALGLARDLPYFLHAAGYHNRTRNIDNAILGITDTTQRKEYWGEILTICPLPREIPGTGYLTFSGPTGIRSTSACS